MCVLLLRGPQTPGELRGRTERMHRFEELSDVQSTLQRLMQREPPLVTVLPRQPGTKEARYAHLLSGEVTRPSQRQSCCMEAVGPARSRGRGAAPGSGGAAGAGGESAAAGGVSICALPRIHFLSGDSCAGFASWRRWSSRHRPPEHAHSQTRFAPDRPGTKWPWQCRPVMQNGPSGSLR